MKCSPLHHLPRRLPLLAVIWTVTAVCWAAAQVDGDGDGDGGGGGGGDDASKRPAADVAEQAPSPPSESDPDPTPAADADEDAAEQPPAAQAAPDISKIDGETLIRQKMQIFRAYEGEWEGVQSYAEAEGNPAYESKGEWSGRFVVDGMYFEMDGYSDYSTGRSFYRWMITYDVILEKYRGWTFNSNGVVTDWLAHHDPDHKELYWRFVDARTGIRGWLRTQTRPNLVTGHGMAKTEGARVLSDYKLEFKRKKLRI